MIFLLSYFGLFYRCFVAFCVLGFFFVIWLENAVKRFHEPRNRHQQRRFRWPFYYTLRLRSSPFIYFRLIIFNIHLFVFVSAVLWFSARYRSQTAKSLRNNWCETILYVSVCNRQQRRCIFVYWIFCCLCCVVSYNLHPCRWGWT